MRSLGRRDPWQIAPRQFTVFAKRPHHRGASHMVGLHDLLRADRAPTLRRGKASGSVSQSGDGETPRVKTQLPKSGRHPPWAEALAKIQVKVDANRPYLQLLLHKSVTY